MNSILAYLDDVFKDKSENEKWMMIMMIVLVIGYLSYALFLPYAEETYQASEKKKASLNKKIKKHKEYIASITVSGDREFYVKKYSKEIIDLKARIKEVNGDINFIAAKLDELAPLMFNKKSWSKFLNNLTKEAKRQGVEIAYIQNEYVKNKGSFGHVLEIGVGSKGEYKNIVKFINKIEKSILVTDIYGMNIRMDENQSTTYSDINISVWGINH